jgi:hypothetical protein
MARLSEFESLIIGTYRLLEFAIKSKASVPPSFSFISTIAVYQNGLCSFFLVVHPVSHSIGQ